MLFIIREDNFIIRKDNAQRGDAARAIHRAGRQPGQSYKTQPHNGLLMPCPLLHLSVVRLTVFSGRSSVTVSPISRVDSLSYKTLL